MAEASGSLHATHVLEFPYTRSLGPVLSRFITGLRDRTVLGITGSDGRVIVPPVEYDPVTSEDLTEFVDVGHSGKVLTWAWVEDPIDVHPLDCPFAWALVQLDGADTGLFHAVDAGSKDAMTTGMRVTIRWADERVGGITDIACFVPEGSS